LAPFGLDAARLAETAASLARARVALLARAADVADRIVTDRQGLLIFDRDGLERTEEETRLRLVAHGLACLSGAPYKPRLASLSTTLDRALNGQGGTLQGCRLIPSRDGLIMVREFKAVEHSQCAADGEQIWDGRWCIEAPGQGNAMIRPLGENGLAQWDRPATLSHAAMLSWPGVWQGDLLLAVPGFWNQDAILCEYAASAGFHATIKSH
jgi:tRNA(Ile)-lysidine synthase